MKLIRTIFIAVAAMLLITVNGNAQSASAKENQKSSSEKVVMHRYVVERTFPDGLNIPMDEVGKDICLNVVSTNAEDMVSWVHSYVTKDKKKTFCIYDAPSEDAIKRAAKNNKLPVDNITEVSVLEPYFYK